jgi:hypothetical protein
VVSKSSAKPGLLESSVQPYEVHALALTQLETALRLNFEAENFASVITLARAADEIFGKLLAAAGKPTDLSPEIRADHSWEMARLDRSEGLRFSGPRITSEAER